MERRRKAGEDPRGLIREEPQRRRSGREGRERACRRHEQAAHAVRGGDPARRRIVTERRTQLPRNGAQDGVYLAARGPLDESVEAHADGTPAGERGEETVHRGLQCR